MIEKRGTIGGDFLVEDNFLPEQDFNTLNEIVRSTTFPYYAQEDAVTVENHQPHNFFLSHTLYDFEQKSPFYPQFKVVASQLDAKALVNMRVNLTIYREGKLPFPSHRDQDNFYGNTAILYFNDNDGPTILDLPAGQLEIAPKANRLLTFDSNIVHFNLTHSSPVYRYVVNINYSPTKGSKYDFNTY